MSRRIDWTEEVEKDNENQVMIKKEQLEIRAIEKGQLLIEGAEEEIIERNDEWQIEDDLVLKEKKIYVCHMSSPPISKIHSHSSVVIITSLRQAHPSCNISSQQ